MNIENFPGYSLVNGDVFTSKGKKLTRTVTNNRVRYKMKQKDGSWVSLPERTLFFLAGLLIQIPASAKLVNNTVKKYYVDTDGTIYGFGKMTPDGEILQAFVDSSGYLAVGIDGYPRTVHSLVANAFIVQGYSDMGLVCMHKDNNKLNPLLNNLSIGTYSSNNSDAYSDKLIASKKGSVRHAKISSVRVAWHIIDLPNLILKYKGINTKIAWHIGCSGTAVKNRRKKMGL